MLRAARGDVLARGRTLINRLRGRTDDDTALVRIQAWFYLCWLGNLAATAVLIAARTDRWVASRLAGLAALAVLAWRRHRAYLRGHEPGRSWMIDAIALAVALSAVGPTGDRGLVFGFTVTAVVFAIGGRWWLVVVAGAAPLAVDWGRSAQHDELAATLFGLGAISTLVATLLRVTLAHEERIRRQRIDLEQERELLGAVLESVDTGVLACDRDNRPMLINRALRELHGLPDLHATDLSGGPPIPLTRPDGTPLEAADLPTTRVLAGEQLRNLELALHSPDGGPRAVVVNAGPIRTAAGELLGAVVAVHDITAARRPSRRCSTRPGTTRSPACPTATSSNTGSPRPSPRPTGMGGR